MQGKYKNIFRYGAALLVRERLRRRIAQLVRWSPLENAEPGCTAIIGVCSRLPHVLLANLRCLSASRWPELRRVICTVDGPPGSFPPELEHRIVSLFPDLNLTFLHYTQEQSRIAEELKLPYVYSWLSWSIALAQVRTRHVFFHDYDALILSSKLMHRYRAFAHSEAKVQGIRWYTNNGIRAEHHLATTFEAFFDAAWLRSLRPIELFNKIRIVGGRSLDLDTTLDAQQRLLPRSERTVVPMELEDLVHPSQMVHQYTMFRKEPGRPLQCGSILMIPFFRELGGERGALAEAVRVLEQGNREQCQIVGDGTRINLALLDRAMIDWQLKQMVEVCVALDLQPDPLLHRYGRALYAIVNAEPENFWQGDFTARQRVWIDAAEEYAFAEALLA